MVSCLCRSTFLATVVVFIPTMLNVRTLFMCMIFLHAAGQGNQIGKLKDNLSAMLEQPVGVGRVAAEADAPVTKMTTTTVERGLRHSDDHHVLSLQAEEVTSKYEVDIGADFIKEKYTSAPTAIPMAIPTAIPTVIPTAIPTAIPTTASPTRGVGFYTVSDQGCGTFSPIGSDPAATPVVFTASGGTFPANDDGFTLITLPRPFPAFGDDSISTIGLSTNGAFTLDGTLTSFVNVLPARALPISTINNPNTDASVPRISFAQEDLIINATFTVDKGTSFVISYDNAAFFNSVAQTAQVQVELFDNGDFDIRWGLLLPDDDFIAVGIEDETRVPPVAIPASLGAFFNADGITVGAGTVNMPQNRCLAFIVSSPP
jgi:hypothetical protein